MSVSIRVDSVTKRYGDTTVISGLTLDVQPGEFFTLLGPSGCGKTTLLRMIAGFNSIEAGSIYFNERRINDVDPAARHIGMVFQNYAVFPHLTVRKNVEFGLRNMTFPRRDIKRTALEYLELVQIGQWAERRPDTLSGGQQQRVALARALVTSPDVLLMDEPLSNLDAKLRVEMREVIRELQKRLNITTVYVTHDQEEAMAVSDRIAVMQSGVVQQVGRPVELYRRPENAFVAGFLGTTNLLAATYHPTNRRCTLQIGGTEFPIPVPDETDLRAHGDVQVSVRPEHFILSPEQGPSVGGTVKSLTFLGVTTHYTVLLDGGREVNVLIGPRDERVFEAGERITLGIALDKVVILESANQPPPMKPTATGDGSAETELLGAEAS